MLLYQLFEIENHLLMGFQCGIMINEVIDVKGPMFMLVFMWICDP